MLRLPGTARWRRWLRALSSHAAVDRDLQDEMRLHVELEAEDLARARGLSPEEARRCALVAFGGIERFAEAHRDVRGTRWLHELAADVRYALRALGRAPGFTAVAVLVLALGIGASTALFSAVQAVVMARLPYPRDGRLVRIYLQNSPTNMFGISVADLEGIVAQQRSFSAIGAMRPGTAPVAVNGDAGRLPIGWATDGFFRALGIAPMAGRAIVAADTRPGAPGVSLVTRAFAVARFGAPAAALGRSIRIDGGAYTIVGVLPAGVESLAGFAASVWPALRLEAPSRRGPFFLHVVARLDDAATMASAARDLRAVAGHVFAQWQASFQDRDAHYTIIPLRRALLGDAPRTLGLLAAAVALVLLIAVANVASLTLVRTTARRREIALRAVLGASVLRIARLLIVESTVVALAGAVAGLVVARAGLGLLQVVARDVPRLGDARLDAGTLLFAAGVALVAGVIVGAYPVARVARMRSVGLHDGERTTGGQGARAAFVVAEFALALPLLAAAGLLLNSVLRLARIDPGYDASRVLTLGVSLPSRAYATDSARSVFWRRALAQVRQVPGVVDVALNTALPPNDQSIDYSNFDLVDHPVPAGTAQPVALWMTASGDFFRLMHVPVLEGRVFGPADTLDATPVVVVSRSWARHYFPDGTAVGRKLVAGGCTTCPLTTVIGVVGDVRYAGLDASAEAVYDPVTLGWPTTVNLFVRTTGEPEAVAPSVRDAVRSIEPGVALDDVGRSQDRMQAAMAAPRHLTMLLMGFAVSAVLLSAVGVFGLLSYVVRTHRREIGVRVALGAQRSSLIALIVGRGLRHAALGVAIGLVVSLLATRWMASLLYGVSPTDPITLGAVTLVLLAVGVAASWLPARRAAAIDPMRAMRVD